MIEWVINASPIIVLSRLERLDLLDVLVPNFMIPSGVVAEIDAGPAGNPAAAWVKMLNPEHVVKVGPVYFEIAQWDLGIGESEVLTWASEFEGRGAILDDYAARKCATTLNIPLRGTVGLLAVARRRGLIEDTEQLLEQLPRIGFRMSHALIKEFKRLTSE